MNIITGADLNAELCALTIGHDYRAITYTMPTGSRTGDRP